MGKLLDARPYCVALGFNSFGVVADEGILNGGIYDGFRMGGFELYNLSCGTQLFHFGERHDLLHRIRDDSYEFHVDGEFKKPACYHRDCLKVFCAFQG